MKSNKRRLTPANFGELTFESGANPDFKVTSATRQAREMELLLHNLSKQVDLLSIKEKRVRQALEERQASEAAKVATEEIAAETAKKAKPEAQADASAG